MIASLLFRCGVDGPLSPSSSSFVAIFDVAFGQLVLTLTDFVYLGYAHARSTVEMLFDCQRNTFGAIAALWRNGPYSGMQYARSSSGMSLYVEKDTRQFSRYHT